MNFPLGLDAVSRASRFPGWTQGREALVGARPEDEARESSIWSRRGGAYAAIVAAVVPIYAIGFFAPWPIAGLLRRIGGDVDPSGPI
ncbi:MAG: hypothetical protein CL933_26630 [Deltaproteobacteria bacterium]|nr:hypothetical protein [Deltaproteobacteria bacterium]